MSQLAYQDPACELTLRQGLEEYYGANPGYDGKGDFLGQPRETVVAHDVAHIVFGLGSSSAEEVVVEVLTVFGCRMTVQNIIKQPKVKLGVSLWKTFGPWRLVRRAVLSTPRMLRAMWMGMHMKKRWPHFAYQPYLDISLRELRTEFGIRLPV